MSNNELYQNPAEYGEDIIYLAKAYYAIYLKSLIKDGAENSIHQHLYQDTVLSREVECFLGDTATDISIINELDGRITQKAEDSLRDGVFLPLEYLCRIFMLNRFERFVITLLSACVMDTGFEKLYVYINNDLRRNSLSPELAVNLYCGSDYTKEDMISSLLENSRLGRHFLTYGRDISENLLKCRLGLKPMIEAFLIGQNQIPEDISRFTSFYTKEELSPILLKDMPYLHMLQYISGHSEGKNTLFYLYGADGIGKKLNIKYLAREMNKSVIFIDFEGLINSIPGLNSIGSIYQLLQSVTTEAILKQGLVCICSSSQTLAEDESMCERMNSILSFVKGDLSVIFFTSDCQKKANLKAENIDVIAIETAADTLEEHHCFWKEMAKGYSFAAEVDLDVFANKFILTPGQIKNIYEEAQRLSIWYGQDTISLKLLLKVCFEKIEHNLEKKAQKVKMVYQWEDLILPDYQKNVLLMACNQIKYKYKVFSEWGFRDKMAYGTGLSIIFSGSPGTGKTMAAQIIAKELGLELYKIELASVVSKYIGETERNLNEIFEEAQKSQAIIFFDEADVLFSKRSEVKDSNDKYSNMEAAFMLQKIEEYTGIVILATNYQQNIDEAFKRRIKFLIDFPFPDKVDRKKLWLKTFPDKLPLSGDIDYDFLADNFELSGSNIKNVALNAAFLAATENSNVGMSHIMRAVVNEFTKSGKKLSKEDFGEYYMYV